jgi:hypothetical protein
MSGKLTKAQLGYLMAVDRGEITTSYGYVNSAPYGITMATHNVCERNGWVTVDQGNFSERKAVRITGAGRAALKDQSHG